MSAVTLVTESKAASPSLGIRLLADLREVFGDAESMFTETILSALRELEESPWSDLKGKPLEPRGLAARLRQYGVKSTTVRDGAAVAKGYRREDLADPWSRYLPGVTDKSAPSVTAAGASVTPSSNGQLTYPPGYIDQASGPATYGTVTSVTPAMCKVCGLPLDKALIAIGDVTHPGCDPVPWPPGTIGEGASE